MLELQNYENKSRNPAAIKVCRSHPSSNVVLQQTLYLRVNRKYPRAHNNFFLFKELNY